MLNHKKSPPHILKRTHQKAPNPYFPSSHLLKYCQDQVLTFGLVFKKFILKPQPLKNTTVISHQYKEIDFSTLQNTHTPSLKPPRNPYKGVKMVAHTHFLAFS